MNPVDSIPENRISTALERHGCSLMDPRAKSKFRRFYKIAKGNFEQAITWTVASIRNDREYDARIKDHGTGYD